MQQNRQFQAGWATDSAASRQSRTVWSQVTRKEKNLTKRQANTILAGIVAVIAMQILCTAVLLRVLDRSRQELDGPSVTTLAAQPIPLPALSVAPEPTPRLLLPEQDIRDARQQVEYLRAQLRAAESQRNYATEGN